MVNRNEMDRVTRRFLLGKVGGLVAASIFLAPDTFLKEAKSAQKEEEKPEKGRVIEVAPVEDLMREHGILSRNLLIYDEIISRLEKSIK